MKENKKVYLLPDCMGKLNGFIGTFFGTVNQKLLQVPMELIFFTYYFRYGEV
jgi:hypothetical protein